MSAPVNLLDFDRNQLTEYFVSLGEKSFRATQLFQWIHHYGITQFDLMTNLSKSLRQKLAEISVIDLPEIITEQLSKDGTRKWVLKLKDNNCIEMVFIPEEDRGTLCVSSQVGCALNCSFCSTGKQGFSRNLSTAEIISQLWIASRKEQVTNIVMMGMGEPLLNFDNVVKAMNIMMDDFGYGLSKRRVTLSTSGIIPEMKALSETSDVSLAVSLHAPTDELRDILVPINKKYPLTELMAVCKTYFKDEPRRKITFEYVMLENINDQKEHADQLVSLLKNIPAKINLIPFNPFPYTQYKRSSQSQINHFRDILKKAGLITVTRKTRGDDIDAACGQLVGKVNDKTRRREQYEKEIAARIQNNNYADNQHQFDKL